MRLTYQTSVATLIQFIALAFLNIGTGTASVITGCTKSNSDCVSNLILSLIFYILITLWFAAVWVLGYYAQERRNKRLAQLLIIAECCIAAVALFNVKHHNNWISLFTSILDFCLAIWVITLAYRLMKSGGGRIVVKHREIKRKPHQSI